MGQIILYAIPILIAAAVFGLFLWMALPKRNAVSIEARLANFADRPVSIEEIELEQPFSERVLKPLIAGITRALGKLTPISGYGEGAPADNPRRESLQHGYVRVHGRTHDGHGCTWRCHIWLVLLMQGEPLALLLFPMIMALVGYLLPVFWLRGRVKKRQKVILKTLPDAIDLMTISVEAGLAFDGAMQRVADKWDNELGQEFKKALGEMRVGKTKREALHELVQRTGVPDLSTFVASIVQADQLGVSIAKVLKIQSEQMRIRRRQRAEEQAHKAPILMMIPMVFLIFPATYIVLLGPAVPKMLSAFGG